MKQVRLDRWIRVLAIAIFIGIQQVHAVQAKASAGIDRLVSNKLDELGIPKSDLCTDEVFLRRVYLDMIGTLPTAQEADQFLSSNAPNKRPQLIEALFERGEFCRLLVAQMVRPSSG